MKIIHIHPSYLMALRFVKPLIEYEKLIGHDTQLIVFDKNFNNNFAKKIDLRLNNLKLLIEIFKFVIFLLKQRPDVVICHNSVQATIPLLFSKILRINHKIYFNHGVTYLEDMLPETAYVKLSWVIANFDSAEIKQKMKENISKEYSEASHPNDFLY